MQAITTIGLDIAKSVFQVHGVDAPKARHAEFGTLRAQRGRMQAARCIAHTGGSK